MRRPFKVGDRVLQNGMPAVILEIEKPDLREGRQTSLDMGRYKIQYEDGSTLDNAPGYLMQHA